MIQSLTFDEVDAQLRAAEAGSAPQPEQPAPATAPAAVPPTIAGSAPQLPAPTDPGVSLPRGIFHQGSWHTQAEVRELTGADEEFVARYPEQADNFEAVLSVGTARIGDIDLTSMKHSERLAITGQLLVGERQMLYLAIVRATFGNERDYAYVCECKAEVGVSLDIAQDLAVTVPEGVDYRNGTYRYTADGWDIGYRLVTGADEREMLAKQRANMAERVTQLLESVVLTINGEPPLDPHQAVLNLPARVRRGLLEVMNTNQPTFDMNIISECPSCGRKSEYGLTWFDLFRP